MLYEFNFIFMLNGNNFVFMFFALNLLLLKNIKLQAIKSKL